MGKSRLLDEIHERAERARPRFNHVVSLSLESEAAMTEVGPLLTLRQGLDINCFLFDAALLRYWSATGQPFSVDNSSQLSGSLAAKTAEVASALAPVIPISLPISYAVDVWGAIEKRGKKRQRYKKYEFKEIDELRAEPEPIRERLSGYLARNIRRELKAKGHSILAFYDSYDKQDRETQKAGAPWLQTFIAELGRGVHVICSRDPLKWSEARWKAQMVPIQVGPLGEEQSRELVRAGLGELATSEIEAHLLKASKGQPLAIESLVNVCLDLWREGGEIDVADIPTSPENAVKSLLDHHRTPQRALAAALATVNVFDRRLYEHLAYVLSVELGILHYDDFVESFVVEPAGGDLCKTHDILTDAVRAASDHGHLRRVALEAATAHLLERSRRDGRREYQTMLALLREVIAGWDSVERMPEQSIETLIDVAYVFYDAGFWNELASIASGTKVTQPALVEAVSFMRALTSRRRVGVPRALTQFERLGAPRDLGRHARSVKLELAYLTELRGNYASVRREFARLSEQAKPFDPTDRTQLRSRLYHADMLTMDGRFRRAAALLDDASEAVGYRELVNWGELTRHLGHVYRLSFELEKAADLYELALQRTAPEAPGMIAKLHTNLAEAYCWFEPTLALEKAYVSLEVHRRGGNEIELCKCQAARAIAFARLGSFPDADEAMEDSKRLGRSAGYPAGVAFAMQAEAVRRCLSKDRPGPGHAIGRLRRKVREIGTYGHLTVAPIALGDGEGLAAAQAGYEWLDPARMGDRLRDYLAL
ncbi:MAG TPA: hypothetical protein VFT19_02500 [Solirubrobacterales bacterium]|nr:hypothetical protein [Solirubrobacterales bacterium]